MGFYTLGVSETRMLHSQDMLIGLIMKCRVCMQRGQGVPRNTISLAKHSTSAVEHSLPSEERTYASSTLHIHTAKNSMSV